MRCLSREYVFPCFYVTGMSEALQKKEQTCCEAREAIRRNQLL